MNIQHFFDNRHSIRPAIVAGVLIALGASSASAEIYECIEKGKSPEYKNTGNTAGCKKLTIEPVVVPKLTTPQPATKAVAAPSPQNYPKVDAPTQKARDSEKRRILEEELKLTESRLADLKRTYNNGEPERLGDERNYQKYIDRTQQLRDDIARTESDVKSIKAEIEKSQ